MDALSLSVDVNDRDIPSWAVSSTRLGSRMAFGLLRPPALPRSVLLLSGDLSSALHRWLRAHGRRGEGVGPGAQLSWHDRDHVAISIDDVFSEGFLSIPVHSISQARPILQYCVGVEAARFALSTPLPSRPPFSGVAEEDPRLLAFQAVRATQSDMGEWTDPGRLAPLLTGVCASEFLMVPEVPAPKAHLLSAAVSFFALRAQEIREREGGGVLWRGALGRITRALVSNVRFSADPGRARPEGRPLSGASDVYRILDYWAGRAVWPFAHHEA